MRVTWSLAVLALVLTARVADAQTPGGYAGGAFMISTQRSHRPGMGSSFPRSGVGGTAVGIIGEVGWFLSPAIGVGVEVSLPRRFISLQQPVPFSTYRTENRYRDFVISGVVHLFSSPTGPIRIAFVGGGAVVHQSSLQRLAPFADSRQVGPFGRERGWSRRAFGVTGGADVDGRVTDHVSVVLQPRIHVIRRPDPSADGGFLGLNAVVFRPAIGVRATF